MQLLSIKILTRGLRQLTLTLLSHCFGPSRCLDYDIMNGTVVLFFIPWKSDHVFRTLRRKTQKPDCQVMLGVSISILQFFTVWVKSLFCVSKIWGMFFWTMIPWFQFITINNQIWTVVEGRFKNSWEKTYRNFFIFYNKAFTSTVQKPKVWRWYAKQ